MKKFTNKGVKKDNQDSISRKSYVSFLKAKRDGKEDQRDLRAFMSSNSDLSPLGKVS